MNYTLTSYRAVERPDICEAFIAGHITVLADFGIENVTSNTKEWMGDPGVYVIVATQDETGIIVGGIRIHIFNGTDPLPMQVALEELDGRINTVVREGHKGGIAECCGLWNSKRVFGRGISYILTRSSVSLAGLLPLSSLIALSAPYTREKAIERGYNILSEVGEEGFFSYPIPSHRACAMVIRDLENLPGGTLDEERRIIKLLRTSNGITLNEVYNGRPICVTYNLLA